MTLSVHSRPWKGLSKFFFRLYEQAYLGDVAAKGTNISTTKIKTPAGACGYCIRSRTESYSSCQLRRPWDSPGPNDNHFGHNRLPAQSHLVAWTNAVMSEAVFQIPGQQCEPRLDVCNRDLESHDLQIPPQAQMRQPFTEKRLGLFFRADYTERPHVLCTGRIMIMWEL